MIRNPDSDLRLMERMLLNRYRADDRFELDDATLRAVADGSRTLTAEERGRLFSSPLTLKRLRWLYHEARRSLSAIGDWRGSEGLLLAAESAAVLQSISTEDGQWTLYFNPGRGGRLMIALKFTGTSDLPAELDKAGAGVEVRDAGGNVLIRGELDEDAELETVWPMATAPREHFRTTGGRFSVLPHRDNQDG